MVSGLNLDIEVNDFFEDSLDELYYGNVRIQPLLYQDNLIRLSTSRDKAQSGNARVEAVMKSKQLEVHQDKSCFLIMADKANYNRIKSEIKVEPLMYGNDFQLKNKQCEKYL